jgi:hypothetical protein
MVYIGQNAEGVKNTMDHISVKKQQNYMIFKTVSFGLRTHKLTKCEWIWWVWVNHVVSILHDSYMNCYLNIINLCQHNLFCEVKIAISSNQLISHRFKLSYHGFFVILISKEQDHYLASWQNVDALTITAV